MYFHFLTALFFLTSFAQAEVTTKQLVSMALEKSSQVQEFDYIQQAAEEVGVKVYLFGGSAAAYAHYVRWYIELQNGAANHQPERFDFDYTNIYRGNQDLDLVIDGTEEQARAFQELLVKAYHHVAGNRQDWEVRLLKGKMGDKLPLLKDLDFKNQHTDTNSTGLFDLTAKEGEPVFRDLLDWENPESKFLKDVAAARITYLFNGNHEDTTRFKEGKNPPIFSALRYLAKLTQYEVKGTEEDLDVIRKIIEDTDFPELSSYVKYKLGEFAKKTLLNSPNSEYAWNLLEKLGLRKKLIEMDGNHIRIDDSLSWWMNKEPLRSKEFGTQGRSAKEIFGENEIIVSHETSSFQAYENITRSSRGEANAFISRQGITGEAALFGDGFYTQTGYQGARGTGLTIRFKLHPDAREGEDFILHHLEGAQEGHAFVIVKNKRALTLIQENINIDLTKFLRLIASGEIGPQDRGLFEKFRRKFNRISVQSEEYTQAVSYIEEYFFIADDFPHPFDFKWESFPTFYRLWTLSNEEGKKYFREIVLPYLKNLPSHDLLKKRDWVYNILKKDLIDKEIIQHIITHKGWENDNEIITLLLKKGNVDKEIIIHLLSQEHWSHRKDLVEHFLKDKSLHSLIAEHVFSKSFWNSSTDWMQIVLEGKQADQELLKFAFSKEHWAAYPQYVKTLIRRKNNTDSLVIKHVLSQKHWNKDPELVNMLIDKNQNHEFIIQYVLSQPFSANHPEWYEKISHTITQGAPSLLTFVLSKKHWSHKEEWVEEYVNQHSYQKELFTDVLSQKHWMHRTDWIETLLKEEKNIPLIIEHIFSKGEPKFHTMYIQELINKGKHDDLIIEHILSQETWRHRTDWIEHYITKGIGTRISHKNIPRHLHKKLAKYVFSQGDWSHSPQYIEELIKGEVSHHELAAHVLNQKHWVKYPYLIEMMLDRNQYFVVASHILTSPDWGTPVHFAKRIFEKPSPGQAQLIGAVGKKHWAEQAPEVIEWFIDAGENSNYLIQILAQDHWKNHPHLYKKLIKNLDKVGLKYALQQWYPENKEWIGPLSLIQTIASKNPTTHEDIINLLQGSFFHPDLVKVAEILMKNQDIIEKEPLYEILSQDPWSDYPQFLSDSLITARGGQLHFVIKNILSSKRWAQNNPYLLIQVVEKSVTYPFSLFGFLTGDSRPPNELSDSAKERLGERLEHLIEKYEFWKNHPVLIKYLNGKPVNLKNIQERIIKKGYPSASEFKVEKPRVFTCSEIL